MDYQHSTCLETVRIVPARWMAVLRVALGMFLAWHFAALYPYGAELFSRMGVLPSASANATHGLFPSLLEWNDSPGMVNAWLAGLFILSLLFAVGIYRRPLALLLWYGGACLFNRNNLTLNPAQPYVGLLCLIWTLLPEGEPAVDRLWRGKSFFKEKLEWPAWPFRAAWVLLVVGYTFSGLDKLFSCPSWRDGSAVAHILQLPLARTGWPRDFLLSQSTAVLHGLTWSALALEILFLPLATWHRTRPWIWLAMTLLQCGILATVSFAELTLGMLLVHAFTFNPAWLETFRRKPQPTSYVAASSLASTARSTNSGGSQVAGAA